MYMFQHKILHRILPTDVKLKHFNIKQHDTCDYCGLEPESLEHVFCECDIATDIWQKVVDWLNQQGYSIEYLTDEQILLGRPTSDQVVNRIIMTTKISIFNNKEKGKAPKLCQILNMLREQFNIEKFIAEKNGKNRFFRGFWAPVWWALQQT